MKSLLEGIVNGDSTKFDALIETVQTSVSIGSTSATCHFHCICLDGNGRPKTGVLIDYLISCLVDYAIPRKRISEALEHSKTNNSFEMGASLVSEAKGLFTREKTTGEGGELILYLFAEKLLKLPQLACKMNLKTSTAMHVHGADGLHVGVDEDKNKLCLYWGESKFHASVNNAISKCMKSIAPLLNSTSEAGSAGHRDIQILQQYLNVDNPELEIVLKNYLNPDHKNFNSVEFRGLCVVGF